jgi:hypothetical protein
MASWSGLGTFTFKPAACSVGNSSCSEESGTKVIYIETWNVGYRHGWPGPCCRICSQSRTQGSCSSLRAAQCLIVISLSPAKQPSRGVMQGGRLIRVLNKLFCDVPCSVPPQTPTPSLKCRLEPGAVKRVWDNHGLKLFQGRNRSGSFIVRAHSGVELDWVTIEFRRIRSEPPRKPM